MAKNTIVAGELYESITSKLFEIGRQTRQKNGYPFDAEELNAYLQAAVEGRFRQGEFFHDTNELTIQIPARKRPTLDQLQKKHDWIKSIERDTSTEEAVTLTLAIVLVPSD